MIVDLSLTDEQRMIEDSVRAFLRERLPLERLREPRHHGAAAERACWDELAGLGVFALALPEAEGGLGLGLGEEALVARAFGLHLASPALLAQMAAPHFTADPQLRAAFAAGSQRAALAYPTGAGTDQLGQLLDGADASHVLLLAGPGGTLFERAALAPAGTGAPVPLIAEAIAAERIALPAPDRAQAGAAATRTSLLLAAYLTGIAQAATTMAVAYAGTREQFGQPIGAFQAIKHACADMATRAAAAEAQCFHAAVTFGHGADSSDDRAETAAALLLATHAATANARANIQIHGAMGFTAECDAHLLLKAAITIQAIAPQRLINANAIVNQ